ncbi:MAG: hypothetical protein HY710_01130 [Candidatus Latescibacteria bacterium]|nr:hypothetical protein [Candidatus Latescibacterota bacterium]
MPKDEYDEDDPFELVAVPLPGGDADYMTECFVDEFIRLGYDDARLRGLFTNPIYAATHAIYREKGERYIQEVIDRVRSRWGGFRFHAEGETEASPLIQVETITMSDE